MIEKSIATIASLIGDKSRASILTALMTGQALTAGELARYANISAQTASNHLSKLLQAKLVKCESFGRHRYYSLYSEDVASILEKLSLLAPKEDHCLHKKADQALLHARTCYDHLAGKLGIRVTQGLINKKFLILNDNTFILSPEGQCFFETLGIDCHKLKKQKRQFLKACLDFSERRYHMAGSLANALLNYCLNERLFIHSKKNKRALIITQKGLSWLDHNQL